MTDHLDPVRKSVQEHYAAQAKAGSSCCGQSNLIYPEQLLDGAPGEAANFSLGCGDPITLAALQPGETVLDLGSGGGLDCFLSARQVGERGHVIGVDMTPEMLARAKATAERMGIQNVEFRQGFLEELPVEDGTVDVIISNCVINLSPDKPRVFSEMLRVLKPGGRISVSDIVIEGDMPEELKKDADAWGACISGALEVGEYTGGLTRAGFVDVRVQPKGDASELLEAHKLKGKIYSAGVTARKP